MAPKDDKKDGSASTSTGAKTEDDGVSDTGDSTKMADSDVKKPHCMSTAHTNLPFSKVTVHPLVLLSVVDHFNRASKVANVERVVGILLGSMKHEKQLDIANSFAVPFDEDQKDNDVWFLDDEYLQSMYHMFHKIAAKERIVGWYHTGPKLRPNDIAINELIKKLTPNPVLVIIEARPKHLGLPTEAYIEVEEVHDDGTPPVKTFEYLPSDIGAEEAEEVGVEHLLRDIKDQTAGTLSQRVTNQLQGLRGLEKYLGEIQRYLKEIAAGELPTNHSIIYLVQDVLNLLPDVSAPEFHRASNVQANDQAMNIYLGSLIRTVIALHNLIDNKLSLQEAEKADKEKLKDKPKEELKEKATKTETKK